jgi:hypothetical protein
MSSNNAQFGGELESVAFFSHLVLVCAAALSVSAQSGTFSPNQGESDGVSAGGKWMNVLVTM